MKFLRALFAGLFTTPAAKAAEPTPTNSPAEMMREMRTAWLTTVPERGTYKSNDEVVAVIMDWPLSGQTITVLSSSVGDASLYTTSTFGIMGGIGHEQVRSAAKAFVECAQRYLSITEPTTQYSYTDSKTLRFYLVTPGGIRTVSFPMTDIEKNDSPARILFASGQEVVTQLRLLAPIKK